MAKKDKQNKAKDEELKKKGKKASKEKEDKPTARDVKGDQWDEQEGGGGFFKLPKGENECLIRVRSVISVGQCIFEYQGKKDTKATSGIGLVLECWPFKIKKDKIKILSDKPAIVTQTFKALNGNKDGNWTKSKNALGADKPDEMQGSVAMGTVFTSDKGHMYLRGALQKTGLAEKKSCPKLTQKGHKIPNLNAMTKEALLDLNPLFQVNEYVTKAINYPGSVAEELVNKIRKKRPEWAVPKKGKDAGKGKGKGKGKKKKLDPNKEY